MQARRLEARAHTLAKDGKVADSLLVASEAATAWRVAAREDERVIPELARYLGHYSVRLNADGQSAVAFAAAIDSVKLWRTLCDQNLDLYGFELSQALMRLAPQAARLHRHEYFTFSEEGAQLLLQLLPTDETKFLLPTARACLRLADIGGVCNEPQKALRYAEIAVQLWRRLAAQDFLQHGPSLISSLRRLSTEQLTPEGVGKAPLKEARRIKLAYLSHRLLAIFGMRRRSVGRSASR